MGEQSLASSPGLGGGATPLQGKPHLHPHPSFELWGDFYLAKGQPADSSKPSPRESWTQQGPF